MARIRIKLKPLAPDRKVLKQDYRVLLKADGLTLSEVAKYLMGLPETLGGEEHTLKFDRGDIYDPLYVEYKIDEDEHNWQFRLKHYHARLLEYEEWYAANKEEIDIEVERRRVVAEEKRQKKITKLEAELNKLKGE